MRNDHQDAVAAGLAVSELSPFGKSADEIRDLWRWVDARINGGIAAGEEIGDEVSDVEFPIILSPEHITAAEKVPRPLRELGDDFIWDAGL
jgi:chromosome partitioning protein